MIVTIITFTPIDPNFDRPQSVGSGEYVVLAADEVKIRTSVQCDDCGMLDADTDGWDYGCSGCRGEA